MVCARVVAVGTYFDRLGWGSEAGGGRDEDGGRALVVLGFRQRQEFLDDFFHRLNRRARVLVELGEIIKEDRARPVAAARHAQTHGQEAAASRHPRTTGRPRRACRSLLAPCVPALSSSARRETRRRTSSTPLRRTASALRASPVP